jgi:ElaB/YqjD/DUF883 family membrane-anchored ribosome-binding protein
MAYTTESAKSVEIEREIEADRRRIEEKIDAIQQRMSPGQIVDEALAYAKSSGGGEYVANLGNAFKNNPIPLALMGVSLAWLMAAPKTTVSSYADSRDNTTEYPLAVINGTMRRSGPIQSEGDKRYSHFVDDAGKRFKALTDETGRRAGHFMDDAGQTFRGFADASGRQIDDIRDEAGKLLDQASGWASQTWRQLTESTGRIGEAVAGAGRSSMDAGAQFNESILKHFKDQPLIGGALAFAVGAALPHTQTEDETLGSAADDVKGKISSEASKVMDKAEAVASDVYEKAASVASDVHDVARDRLAEEANNLRSSGATTTQPGNRHH